MEIELRKLQMQDAEWMLEWMHDEDLVKNLQTEFLSKKISDCRHFIEKSLEDQYNIHLAIVNKDDLYLGTVSLKHIARGYAEFGIAMRRMAIGQGIAIDAMMRILAYGFLEMKLYEIYWCVNKRNKRAERFYDKHGFKRINFLDSPNEKLVDEIEKIGSYTIKHLKDYWWYSIRTDHFQHEVD